MSPTLRISSLAESLRASGVDVLDFSAGQPDFSTAVVEEIERARGLAFAPEQVLVSCGAKASLFFAIMALIDPGDEVLLPTPYWVSYPEQIGIAEGRAVLVPCSDANGFKLRAADLESAVTPRTRALILNYPSNPSGACYSRDELEPLAEVCARHGLWVIADEIYSRLIYDRREFASIAGLGREIRERTIVVDGMSKSYSMTGWRIGYAAGPSEVISSMARIQSHATSNASSIGQWASVEALRSCEDEVRRRVAGLLRELDGVSCVEPEGAFYAFPNVSGVFGKRAGDGPINSGQQLAEYLLDRARVAVVPGDAFGAPEHIRISYAVSVERIREGVRRIGDALAALSG
jgi:aspartate/methionine/tyrosine aminotransferase